MEIISFAVWPNTFLMYGFIHSQSFTCLFVGQCFDPEEVLAKMFHHT